jgi:hypothetical protein
MHDAKQTSLSKITQGQKILVVEQANDTGFDFGRPKDTTAVFRSVTKIQTKPDQWTGKVYTVQITGGRLNEGRYGTTHVYVAPDAKAKAKAAADRLDQATDELAAAQAKPKTKAKARIDVDIADVKRGDLVLVEPSVDGKTMLSKLPGGGEPAQVIGIMYQGKSITLLFGEGRSSTATKWTVVGHEDVAPVRPTSTVTPKGHKVNVAADGTVRVVEVTPATDAEADARNAQPADPSIAMSDRCGKCKGFGVVRKRGTHAGEAYRTSNGADQATANGNSVLCPACKGEALVSRSA